MQDHRGNVVSGVLELFISQLFCKTKSFEINFIFGFILFCFVSLGNVIVQSSAKDNWR